MTGSGSWLAIDADDIPMRAIVRCASHGRTVIGDVIDVMCPHTSTSFIVRDRDGSLHAVPDTAAFETLAPMPGP
jgi:hypothetical protein